MLREISCVRQDEPGVLRRWFQDEYFDLFVWSSSQGEIKAFQLAYDRGRSEHVLGWEQAGHYYHNRVEQGRDIPPSMMTPLLIAGGRFPKYRVLTQFDARSGALDEAVRRFVREKVVHYYFARRPARRWRS